MNDLFYWHIDRLFIFKICVKDHLFSSTKAVVCLVRYLGLWRYMFLICGFCRVCYLFVYLFLTSVQPPVFFVYRVLSGFFFALHCCVSLFCSILASRSRLYFSWMCIPVKRMFVLPIFAKYFTTWDDMIPEVIALIL